MANIITNIIRRVLTGNSFIVLLLVGVFLSAVGVAILVKETSGFFWINIAYLSGLVGNGLILLILYYFKSFRMTDNLKYGVNWIVVITIFGYAGINAMYFSLLLIAIVISSVVSCIKITTESGTTPADWLEGKFK